MVNGSTKAMSKLLHFKVLLPGFVQYSPKRGSRKLKKLSESPTSGILSPIKSPMTRLFNSCLLYIIEIMPKIFSILFLFFAGIFPSLVHAEIQSCFSSITPTTTYTNSQATISVIVEQQSDGPANWIQVYVPPALPYVSAAATGWSVSEQDQYVTFTGGQLQPYQTATFNITVETGSTPDGPWQLSTYVADNGTGEPNVGCDGSSGLTVLDGSSNVQLSAITLRNITDSQATLTFTTNIAATSQVVYGTTTSYGSTKTNSTATTSHSFTLDGLSKNTSYNFQISATSGSSSASSGNQTFTSAATSANLTPTIIYISPTTGPTPTAIIQIMPTPTPLPDRTKPTITIQALQSLPYKFPPTITGTVGDNVSVSWLEYSVDAGKTWNRIKEATGLNTNYVTFSFVPTIQQLNNGANSLLIRARDTANNPAISSPLTFTLDTQGPEIFLSTSFDKPFTVSPTVKGSATDQSGETRIEYAVLHQCSNGSTQQCRNVVSSFQPVDSTSFSGDTTSFTTRLPPLDDGTYLLQIKATDPLGNEQVQIFQTLIIDRLAPQFGSHVLHVGPIVLQPETNHVYLVPQQKEIQIILSLIGGPDQVQITGSSSPVQLLYNPVTNLWQGTLLFSEPGITTVAGIAKDGAGNITNTTLFTVQTIAHGTITNGYGTYINSTIKILQKDQETGRFLPWEADVYSQKNLQTYTQSSTLSWFLPPGSYLILIDPKDWNYLPAQTPIFQITYPQLVAPQLVLQKNTGIPILRNLLPLVTRSILAWTPTVELAKQPEVAPLSPTVPKELPQKSILDPYLGAPVRLYYANTWHPDSADYLARLPNDPQTLIVFPHETQPSIDLFRERGGYVSTMIADPDGELLQSLPYHMPRTKYEISTERTATFR